MKYLAFFLAGVSAFAQRPPTTSATNPKQGAAQAVPPRPAVSVGSINQTPTGNCNVTVGVNTGNISIGDLNCRGINARTGQYFKKRLSKVERDQAQLLTELDNMRKQYLALLATLKPNAESSETDRKIVELLNAGKIDEASALHKEILAQKEEQAGQQGLDLAREQLTQGRLSELQFDWPTALAAYQKAHEALPENRDAALGYGRALEHLAAAEMRKSAELRKESAETFEAVERAYEPKVAAQDERFAASRAEFREANTELGQVTVQMVKLLDPQGKVKDAAALETLLGRSEELKTQMTTIKERMDAEFVARKRLADEWEKARIAAQEQAAPLDAEAERLSVQAHARILEAEKVIAKPLAELRQLVKADFEKYAVELLIAIQEQIVVDMALEREPNSNIMQSTDLQIEILRRDKTAEPFTILVLEAQRDVLAFETMEPHDEDESDKYSKQRLIRLCQDVITVYTPKALRDPKYYAFVVTADMILAEQALDEDRHEQADKYSRAALIHIGKTPMSVSLPAAVSFRDRNLWIPMATILLAQAEGYKNLPAAEKDFQKAIRDLTVLVKENPERYTLDLASAVREFAEFLIRTGNESKGREEFEQSVKLADAVLARTKSEDGNDVAKEYILLFALAGKSQDLTTDRCALLRKAWDASKDPTINVIKEADYARSEHQCSEEELSQIPTLLPPPRQPPQF